jgi:hypothetical protein
MRIFMESNDRVFREKVRNVFPAGVNILTCGTRRNGNVKALAEDTHLAFIEYRSLYDFKDIMPCAKVIVMSETYSRRQEYLSIMLGAKGFITLNIDAQTLQHVIDTVTSGQIWIKRKAINRIFREYRRIIKLDSLIKRRDRLPCKTK